MLALFALCSLLVRVVPCESEKLRIHFVPHTHDDAGWLKTADQYYVGSRQDIQLAGVQYILDTVVQSLSADPKRKFTYAEMSFFSRWWRQQSEPVKDKVRKLVADGQLQFVNGGWVQHDEAASHYVGMIDQTTRGHRFLQREFNYTPTVAWQIDPFGHSSTQASLLTAKAGFDAVFFARSDYQDLALRKAAGQAELVWRPSEEAFCDTADVFAGNFPAHYGPPSGFNYEWGQHDPPVQDDPNLEDFNLDERVELLLMRAREQAATAVGSDVMFLMGTDFTYACAEVWFKNIDKLIAGVNADGRAEAMYSTPIEYLKAKAGYERMRWPLRTDDFFPYADQPHAYWTGYFSSRPAAKGFIREASSYLNAARQLVALDLLSSRCPEASAEHSDALDELEAAVALNHHHDAITGTAKQHVADDYSLRLHAGLTRAQSAVSQLLSASMFAPYASRCYSAASDAVSDDVHRGAQHKQQQQRRQLRSGPQKLLEGSGAAAASASSLTTVFMRSAEHAVAVRAGPASDAAESNDLDAKPQSRDQASKGQRGAPHSSDLGAVPELHHCEMGNVSLCAVTTLSSAMCKPMLLVMYNSLPQMRTEGVQVPLLRSDCNYTVAQHNGAAVPSATLWLPPATVCVQRLLHSVHATAAPLSQARLVFEATLPALGLTTFLLKPGKKLRDASGASDSVVQSGGDAAAAAAPRLRHLPDITDALVTVHQPAPGGPCALCDAVPRLPHESSPDSTASEEEPVCFRDQVSAPPLPDGAAPVLENDHVKLEFDPLTGRPRTLEHKASGSVVPFELDLTYWEARNEWPFGGAYLMRPGTQVPLSWADGSSRLALTIVETGTLVEAQLAWNDWGTLVLRLWNTSEALEVEWTVGPIPNDPGSAGKEVTLRVLSGIDSGDLFETDSNGRQMMLRRRNWRQTWDLDNLEPVAGNFYPITSAISISGPVQCDADAPHTKSSSSSKGQQRDRKHSTTSQSSDRMSLQVITERAQAAASLESGGVHVLLHRRLLQDDQRGVAEHLNETQCGCYDCNCPGLVARGTLQILLTPSGEDSAAARMAAAARANDPPLQLYARADDVAAWASHHLTTYQQDRFVHPHASIQAPPLPSTALSRAFPAVRLRWSALQHPPLPNGQRSSSQSTAQLPPAVSLVTLAPWDSDSKGQTYLVRFAHRGDIAEDAKRGHAAEAASLDLCDVLPLQGYIVKVREMTLSCNAALRASRERRQTFAAVENPACHKANKADCEELDTRQRKRLGGGAQQCSYKVPEPFDIEGLDCAADASKRRKLDLQPLEVRTLLLTVGSSR